MKKRALGKVGFAVIATLGFAACNTASKLATNVGNVTYAVNPEVVAVRGDSIQFTIKGTYPEWTFLKKGIVKSVPVLVYEGGETTFEEIKLIGEKVDGEDGKVVYFSEGGDFTFTSNKVAYTPEMEKAVLVLKNTATLKGKDAPVEDIEIAKGVNTTALLVKENEYVPMFSGKSMVAEQDTASSSESVSKGVDDELTANIFFQINQAQVRYSELRGEEMKAMKTFVKTQKARGANFVGAKISSYASPDGEFSRNENLAGLRAKTTIRELKKYMKSWGVKNVSSEEFFVTETTAEDWLGFKAAMEKSSIEDKELILRVLSMYPDGENREREIKNLAATYEEIAEKILPQLRRSVITLTAEGGSDVALVEASSEEEEEGADMIMEELTVDQILAEAANEKDLSKKVQIYTRAQAKSPDDWRVLNNIGAVKLMQKDFTGAKGFFEKAKQGSDSSPIVNNNLGIVAMYEGDSDLASDFFMEAAGGGTQVDYNQAILDLKKGEYDLAVMNFGDTATYNAALAQVLSGSLEDASNTLSELEQDASVSYLKAITSARLGVVEDVVSHLKDAIQKDASYSDKAKNDIEFILFEELVEQISN